MTGLRFSGYRRLLNVMKLNAIENVLSRRQIFDQQLRREIIVWQRIDRHRVKDRLETLDR